MPQAINTLRRLIAVEHKQLGKLCALTDDVMACLRNLEHFDDDVQAYVNRVNAGVQKKREDGDARRQEQQGHADVPAQHEQVRAQLSELGVSEDACAAAFAALERDDIIKAHHTPAGSGGLRGAALVLRDTRVGRSHLCALEALPLRREVRGTGYPTGWTLLSRP